MTVPNLSVISFLQFFYVLMSFYQICFHSFQMFLSMN